MRTTTCCRSARAGACRRAALDDDNRVVGANEAARAFFDVDASAAGSLVEVTLESRLLEVVAAGEAESETPLVHHRRTVLTEARASRREGSPFCSLTDITELRHLARVRREFVANSCTS